MRSSSRLEDIFAVSLIVCFFMPWVSLGGLISFSGYQIPDLVKGVSSLVSAFSDEPQPMNKKLYILYLLYLIPICSVTTIVLGRKGISSRISSLFAGLTPLAAFTYCLSKSGTDIFEGMAIGAWLTIIAAVGILVSLFMSNDSKKTQEQT
ncbi:MAG: hypothetical protein KAS70_06920 [Planctomycetes bacterium]|nr:hypothetical protein [Planctomycetota bacterium]